MLRKHRHLCAAIKAEDAPTVLAYEGADLSGTGPDLHNGIAHRCRKRREQLAIAWLVVQLVEKSSLILARYRVVRGAQLLPRHGGGVQPRSIARADWMPGSASTRAMTSAGTSASVAITINAAAPVGLRPTPMSEMF